MVLKLTFKWLLVLCLGLGQIYASGQSIQLENDPASLSYGQLLLENISTQQLDFWANKTPDQKQWSKLFQVFTGNERPDPDQPQVLGSYIFDGSTLRFEPRFPFEILQSYYVVFNSDPKTELVFIANDDHSPEPPSVMKILPSGKQLPSNLIRIYIHFSVPMRRDYPYKYIHLTDDSGDTLDNIIYPADPALWSIDGKRLTVLFDPGRIKRGLPAHKQWGLALQSGMNYQLVIGEEFPSQEGMTLGIDIIHTFEAAVADQLSPNTDLWRIQPPSSSTASPLIIDFDESLDQAQCLRWIKVTNIAGQVIPGNIELRNEEKIGLFIPDHPWGSGKYLLQINNQLEDRSGNSIRKPFEVEMGRVNEISDPGWEVISFTVN